MVHILGRLLNFHTHVVLQGLPISCGGGVTTGSIFVFSSTGADPNSRIWPMIKSLDIVHDASRLTTLQ